MTEPTLDTLHRPHTRRRSRPAAARATSGCRSERRRRGSERIIMPPVLALLVILLMSGCANRRRPNRLDLVSASGALERLGRAYRLRGKSLQPSHSDLRLPELRRLV